MNEPKEVKPIDDIRSYIAALEINGELHRIKTERDWKFELCHVSKVNEEQKGAGAVLRERQRLRHSGIDQRLREFTSWKRLAIALEQDLSLSMSQLSKK